MRRRLLAALVGVAVLTLVVYAVPRSFMVADLVRSDHQDALDRSATLAARVVGERMAEGVQLAPTDLADLVMGDQQLVVTTPTGHRVATPAIAGHLLRASAPVDGGGRLELRESSDRLDRRMREALVPLALVALGAAAVATLVAVFASRRLVAPFSALAHHAERLDVEAHGRAPRSGLAEVDRIAEGLDRSRDRLAAVVRQEREFSSNASHQLRNPLAALRLRIEDVTLWPQVDAEVRTELEAALGEVDRLTGTIEDLLRLARDGAVGAAAQLDLRQLALSAGERWRPIFDGAHRAVRVGPGPAVVVSSSSGAVLQVLDVLLENALVHGSGAVTVEVEDGAGGPVVRVSDQGALDPTVGDRLFDRSVRSASSPGSGIGLALARTLAATVGARLRLVEAAPTTFEVAFGRRG